MSDKNTTNEFVKLWTAESRRVYAYIITLHPNMADADELFQETALTAWQQFERFDPGTNFRAWACKIARNKLGSFWQLRRHGSVHFGDELVDLAEGLMATKADVLDEQFEALADCIARLHDRDKHLLELRYNSGETVRTIAQEIKRSPDAIYKRFRRIHLALLNCVTRVTAESE